ncbi:divergent PAP2 family protein [Candidatus Aerophobetes bacterium]|nr:divergent PAP2 family protein [Candidatus Aerophobetes bacterium]
MSKTLYFILTHPLLLIVFWAWVIAQGIKVIVSAGSEKKIKLRRFIEPGGMPSSHAAVVVALLTGVGVKEGMGSTIFIVTLVLALVTIYEAIGVRRETGRQAELLNELSRHLSPRSPMKYKLTEQLGHNPIEVLVGGILGFFIALLFL